MSVCQCVCVYIPSHRYATPPVLFMPHIFKQINSFKNIFYLIRKNFLKIFFF